MQSHRDILDNFTVQSLPTLDVVVLGALERLATSTVPQIDSQQFKQPLVVGSGNAEATGRIIFADSAAVYASESTVDQKLASLPDIDEVVLISASGGKHAPVIARKAQQAGKHVTLLTTTANSAAGQALSTEDIAVHLFLKNREPYTYNTSTYMSMIQGQSQEDIAAIQNFIVDTIASLELPDFASYSKYYLIVPPQFEGIVRMLDVKFIELFGRQVARDVETSEYVSHATTVVESDELFISFGQENVTWGKPENRLHVPLPEEAGYVAMMAIGYYIIGQIQRSLPAYFMDNIADYCQFISQVFGEDIKPIVEGN